MNYCLIIAIKAIETGMIFLIIDIKGLLLCIFFELVGRCFTSQKGTWSWRSDNSLKLVNQKCILFIRLNRAKYDHNFLVVTARHNHFWVNYYLIIAIYPKSEIKDAVYLLVTGKSFSEALILASTNSQYDKRLFMELPCKLQTQNMGSPCSAHVQRL